MTGPFPAPTAAQDAHARAVRAMVNQVHEQLSEPVRQLNEAEARVGAVWLALQTSAETDPLVAEALAVVRGGWLAVVPKAAN